MRLPLAKLAQAGLPLAAVAVCGPIAAPLLLANPRWRESTLELLGELAKDGVVDLTVDALKSRFGARPSGMEESMRQAALRALRELRLDAYAQWFDSWDATLRGPADGLFASVESYFRADAGDQWWDAMEFDLARWHAAPETDLLSLQLTTPPPMPEPLREHLRARHPETLERLHREVLLKPELESSWRAYQQQRMDEALQLLRVLTTARPAPPLERVWKIPPPTPHFQDRPDLMVKIEASLQAARATALTALQGLGGIGKTQLARRFADKHCADYQLGIWLEAETEASLLTSLAALAPLVGVQPQQDQKAMIDLVLNAIPKHEPWLAIFDNAVAPEALRPYVDRLHGQGDILITSRNEHWDTLARSVSVEKWSLDESVRFLLDRAHQTDEPAAEALAKDLDGLILALEHAAAYMNAGDGMSLADYRAIWADKLKWAASQSHDYPNSVAATLGLSLDAVQQNSPTAYDLLSLFAWLAPDRIPRKELLEAGAKRLPESLRTALGDHDQ